MTPTLTTITMSTPVVKHAKSAASKALRKPSTKPTKVKLTKTDISRNQYKQLHQQHVQQQRQLHQQAQQQQRQLQQQQLLINSRDYAVKERQTTWHLFNAHNQTVGRLAVQVARLLQGKHKPIWTPAGDVGDHVVIINAKYCRFTGDKWNTKLYRHHSGFPGGLKEITAQRMHDKNPVFALQHAIDGNLQTNHLKHTRIERLHVYPTHHHDHHAQFPQVQLTPEMIVEADENESTSEEDNTQHLQELIEGMSTPQNFKISELSEYQPKMGGQKGKVKDILRHKQMEEIAKSKNK